MIKIKNISALKKTASKQLFIRALTKIEKQGVLNNLKNINFKIMEASGPAVVAESQMRLLAQFSLAVQNELRTLHKTDKYWDCRLEQLEDAILIVFKNQLNDIEREKIEYFRKLRNKLLHADFIGLLIKMKIDPRGREINPKTGERNILSPDDIKEGIICIDRNFGFDNFKKLANEVTEIIQKLILLD